MPENMKDALLEANDTKPKMDSVAAKKKKRAVPKKKTEPKAPAKKSQKPNSSVKKSAPKSETTGIMTAFDANEEEIVKVRIVGRPKPPAEVVEEALSQVPEGPARPAPKAARSAASKPITTAIPAPSAPAREPAPVPFEEKVRAIADNRGQARNLVQTIDPLPTNETAYAPVGRSEDAPLPPKRSVKLYRRIAYIFLALTLVLVGIVGYYTMVKVDIVLVPNQERVSNKFIFDIVDKDTGQATGSKALVGAVKELDVALNRSFTASGAEVIGEEVVGKVTIINDYTQSQPLVASTRLLSADNKLFRLRSTVTVPAGAKIEAEVYADKASEDMAVPAGKFTIPGLWAGLQDQIYAVSESAMVYQKKEKRIVKTEDIEGAVRDLKEELLAKAKTEINGSFESYDQMIYRVDENSIDWKADSKDGEEKDSFTIDMTAKVTVVAFASKDAVSMAKDKFLATLAANKEIVVFDDNSLVYSLESQDPEAGRAVVNATFEGKVSLRNIEGVIEAKDIVGLSEKELKAYLESLPEIAGYEIKFTPNFLKRVPSLSDRIKIEIKK